MPQSKPVDLSPNGFHPPVEPIDPFIIDMAKLESLAHDENQGEAIRAAFALLGPDLPAAAASAWFVATIQVALPGLRWRERYASRKRLRISPTTHPGLRRCARVVAMVHELHKVGYQRIRAVPQDSPSGMHWRCNITYADNVADDGFTILDFDNEKTGKVAHYSSAHDNGYFGWTDAATMSARQMAAAFLDRFPIIGQNGQGRDWLYAGWLTDFLGLMENADEMGLIAFTGDYPPDPVPLNPWMPPPPVPKP